MGRRHPHQPFSPDMIAPFLDGRIVESAELFNNGKSNSNYHIKLSDGSEYVARVYGAADIDFEHYIHKIARTVALVPDILFHTQQCAVLTYMPGETLGDAPQFAGKAAQALTRLSSISFDSRGQIQTDGTIKPWPFGRIGGFVEIMLTNKEVIYWLGSERIEHIRTIMANEEKRLSELEDHTYFVHGDFNPYNILIHNGEVSAVLDWEFAHSGTPYMDIGNMLRNIDKQYHDAIYDGLVAGGMEVPADWKERAQLVDLGSQLQFLTYNKPVESKQRCISRVDRFIKTFL
ncbi:aminoglycoside phosphotransferase family protein [candidate division KSB1 bacterium]|nr:aminoglycoside phosphotransferase family protein [candidate division KSB1 bacterium]